MPLSKKPLLTDRFKRLRQLLWKSATAYIESSETPDPESVAESAELHSYVRELLSEEAPLPDAPDGFFGSAPHPADTPPASAS